MGTVDGLSAPEPEILKNDTKERWIVGSYNNGFISKGYNETISSWDNDYRFNNIPNPGNRSKPAHGYIGDKEYIVFGVENMPK